MDRDELEPEHFQRWVEFAKKERYGLELNPTFFSHEMVGGLTLSSPDQEVRQSGLRMARRVSAFPNILLRSRVSLCHEHLDSGRL